MSIDFVGHSLLEKAGPSASFIANEPVFPFLKWAGGKQQLLAPLRSYRPPSFNCYFEPFVGGGAVFFDLSPKAAILADANEELINCYHVVQNDVWALLEHLKQHRNTSKYFYEMRSKNPARMNEVARASRFIYLNRTCFNGLYRVNRKGQFNVPFGNYKNPTIRPKKKLLAAHVALQNVHLHSCDFREITEMACKGDFVYLDPPYFPAGKFADFRRYHKVFFSKEDHIELSRLLSHLAGRGCYVMLSNSDTPFTRSLYKDWNLKSVSAKRLINCNAERRDGAKELIVTNYETQN